MMIAPDPPTPLPNRGLTTVLKIEPNRYDSPKLTK
jgi:hypothetical protein